MFGKLDISALKSLVKVLDSLDSGKLTIEEVMRETDLLLERGAEALEKFTSVSHEDTEYVFRSTDHITAIASMLLQEYIPMPLIRVKLGTALSPLIALAFWCGLTEGRDRKTLTFAVTSEAEEQEPS